MTIHLIAQGLLWYCCLLFSLCVHEAAHAAMAFRCGDPSAKFLGRMTLNPLAHIDPIGTVALPVLMIFWRFPYLVGWAKPVPFNPRNLKDMRRDPVFIALAGPGSNLSIIVLFTIILRVGVELGLTPELALTRVLASLIMINMVLMAFNMIPVPPLDGHHVLYFFLPPGGKRVLEQIGPFGIVIAILVARPWLSLVVVKLVTGINALFPGNFFLEALRMAAR
ncbi:MAG TPA: site-2 protease family protein [Candidatus Hydrogenedentes bacterium]|nr:site-2 protease family protein [Candidatus Hydrogenedentota bacterium]HIJ73031.1 site-2 protease family protein [Candidatus Hydrogenedentota bacterium]